jgi:hypothetical protein
MVQVYGPPARPKSGEDGGLEHRRTPAMVAMDVKHDQVPQYIVLAILNNANPNTNALR